MNNSRIERERKTVDSMIALYCHHFHSQPKGLCDDCKNISEYSDFRLDNCVFGTTKPVCAKCRVHCYKPEMREKIKAIMRFAGPRMIFTHPHLALMHIADKYTYSNVKINKT